MSKYLRVSAVKGPKLSDGLSPSDIQIKWLACSSHSRGDYPYWARQSVCVCARKRERIVDSRMRAKTRLHRYIRHGELDAALIARRCLHALTVVVLAECAYIFACTLSAPQSLYNCVNTRAAALCTRPSPKIRQLYAKLNLLIATPAAVASPIAWKDTSSQGPSENVTLILFIK